MPGSSPDGGRRQHRVRRMAARRRAKRGHFAQHRAPRVERSMSIIAQQLAPGRWPLPDVGCATMRKNRDIQSASMREGAATGRRNTCAKQQQLWSTIARQVRGRACTIVRGGAPHARRRFQPIFFLFDLNLKIEIRYNMATILLMDPSHSSDTTVGEPALEGLKRLARTDSPRKTDRSKSDQLAATTALVLAGGGGGFWERKGAAESLV
ncbi:hypothetical protein F511_45670 [Dorcoceras hygrometricum]|uniref:Uncharacterized protein n=1 Tax=Dorcoceras hygrometricum TaxID=472368 RepID=A0A2Z6ZVC6_9LAMI|nr:hypothetical protein F511_45670 [Dorcoceras hygrometricum]